MSRAATKRQPAQAKLDDVAKSRVSQKSGTASGGKTPAKLDANLKGGAHAKDDAPAKGDSPTKVERRRQEIVEAASRLFAELGYDRCDMDRVASKLKIAKGTIYLYFKSKQELFFACVDWGMICMQAAVRAAADAETDPFERIAQAIRAYLAFFSDNPEQVELLIQERAIFKDRKRPTYFEYRDAARVHWRAFYQRLIDDGRIRDDLEVEWILDTLGNLVYGTMFTNHFVGPRGSFDQQGRRIVDIVFNGLLSESERTRRRRKPAGRTRSS